MMPEWLEVALLLLAGGGAVVAAGAVAAVSYLAAEWLDGLDEGGRA